MEITRRFVAAAALLTLAGCDFITVAALNFVETTEFEVRGTRLFMNGEINSKTGALRGGPLGCGPP